MVTTSLSLGEVPEGWHGPKGRMKRAGTQAHTTSRPQRSSRPWADTATCPETQGETGAVLPASSETNPQLAPNPGSAHAPGTGPHPPVQGDMPTSPRLTASTRSLARSLVTRCLARSRYPRAHQDCQQRWSGARHSFKGGAAVGARFAAASQSVGSSQAHCGGEVSSSEAFAVG
jgi:hypothetical protein